MFPEYKNFNLATLDRQMLEQWQKEHLFEQSCNQQKGHPQFVFFDGPPSANGMPGIHHVMARTIKDTFCRYKTMRGYRVDRKAGWDTHGLPVELGVEKKLGITKEDIGKKISVDDYNRACREEVMKYTREWESLTLQMGYWVDLEHPYITYDNKYIETLWYLLSELYKKGLLYKGYTIQPYSPMAGTGLSSHELNQPGCYRDVKDTTCTAQFRLLSSDHIDALIGDTNGKPVYILAWTTTPWTLPSNTALCVGPKIEYVAVEGENPYTKQQAVYILAAARLGAYSKELGEEPRILARISGDALVGLHYEQLFPWVKPAAYNKDTNTLTDRSADAFRVIAGDYVTTEDGTGIVHIAPTFGADDKRVAEAAGIPALYMINANGETRPMVDLTGKYYLISDLLPEFAERMVNQELYSRWQGEFVKNAYNKANFWPNDRYDEQAAQKAENLDVRLCIFMKTAGTVFKIEKHTHSYPHCWRTDTPIVYYPLDSWFIRASSVKDEMQELNRTINWQPESTGTGRFGKWLENLNDWNLSRSRYWGTPLPIWRTADGSEEICIGSIKQLFEEIDKSVAAGLMKQNPWSRFRVGDYSSDNYSTANIDLHRPYIDQVVLCSSKGEPMRRELDLIDVWFDSGAMPYAQSHYPFENTDAPLTADFISEGVDQTRGWFYTLHAIHTMIGHDVAFRNVISNGLVLDKNGDKMSKRLGNAVDPFSTMSEYGADAVRWYMLTNAAPWDNLRFDKDGVDEVRRKFFATLYNTYSFFALYANVDHWQPSTESRRYADSSDEELDRWLASRLASLVDFVTTCYEAYEPTRAGRAISDFVQDELSNWYVRLSRKRFWGEQNSQGKSAAYQTLYDALTTVAKLMAPIAPFFADRLYRDLTGGTSVHLSDWPKADKSKLNQELEQAMRRAGQVTSTILALRKKASQRVRQPLNMAIVPATDETLRRQLTHMRTLIQNETNIKQLRLVGNDDEQFQLVKRIRPNFKVLGKKVGAQMKAVAAEIASLSQQQIRQLEKQGTLLLEQTQVSLTAEDVEITTQDMPGWLIETNDDITVALDLRITEELVAEGISRELVNRLQTLRKTRQLNITDRIKLSLLTNAEVVKAAEMFRDYISAQTLTTDLQLHIYSPDMSTEGYEQLELDDNVLFAKLDKC